MISSPISYHHIKTILKRCNMWTRSEAIRILNDHNMRIEDFKDFINMVGIKDEYSTKELKDFLGY